MRRFIVTTKCHYYKNKRWTIGEVVESEDDLCTMFPNRFVEDVSLWDTVPSIWEGKTSFIIGGGPSIRSTNLSLLKDHCVIGVNDAYVLGDFVKVLFFGDNCWYSMHKDNIHRRPIDVYTCQYGKKDLEGTPVKVLKRMEVGFSPLPYECAWNKNSGAAAVNLAYLFGSRRIVLVGFDMHLGPSKEGNWHPNPLHTHTERTYTQFIRNFIIGIKDNQKKFGFQVLNATDGSAMTLFPQVKLEEIV